MSSSMDGGWGWMVLLGAFVSYFIADGWAYSFGVIFPEMVDYFEASKGNTALVPTLLYGIPMIISPVICAITAVCGCRTVALTGGILASMALILAAFSGLFYMFCLSIGLLSSVGFAMVYVPAIVAVTCNFEKRRGLATGLAVTGSGLGSFAFPPLLGFLIEKYAWRGMLLIVAGICLELLVAGALYRPVDDTKKTEAPSKSNCQESRVSEVHPSQLDSCEVPLSTFSDTSLSNIKSPSDYVEADSLCNATAAESYTVAKVEDRDVNFHNRIDHSGKHTSQTNDLTASEPVSSAGTCRRILKLFCQEFRLMICAMLDKSVLSDGPFLLFCGVNFFIYLWVSVPYVYLVDRALLLGIEKQPAEFLLSTVGITRTIGQIVIGIIGDIPQVSSNVLYGFSIGVIGFATILVPVCTNYTLLCIYAAVFGLFVSVTYVLPMMCLVEIITLQKATNAFGFLQFVQGLGTLIGTPIVGFVFDMSGDYNVSFFVAGAWILTAGVCLCPMPCILRYTRR